MDYPLLDSDFYHISYIVHSNASIFYFDRKIEYYTGEIRWNGHLPNHWIIKIDGCVILLPMTQFILKYTT